jgi:hypothetical protein
MAEPATRLSPGRGNETIRLEPHDHEQLELQLGHGSDDLVRPASSPDGPESLDLELYVFIPRNVGINAANYTRVTFYEDMTSFVRADLPPVELGELADLNNRRSPLVPLAASLAELGNGAPAGGAIAVQIKLFGHAFGEAVRFEADALARSLAEAALAAPMARWSFLDRIDRFGEQAQGALNAFRLLGRQLTALSYAAPQAQQVFRQTDEYSSLCLDATLADLSLAADATPAFFDGSCFVPRLKLVLARHARPEAEYRRWVGFLNLQNTRGDAAEYFSYRQSLLKKAVHQALWVETHRLTRDQYLRNVSSMVAAGLAATWAAVAQLPMQWAKLSSTLQATLVVLPVVAYVAKDRIKELTRDWLMRRAVTYDQSIAISTSGLGDAGTGELSGTLSERVRFVDLDQVPPDVMACRVAQRTVSGSELAGESCLHYLRKLEVVRDQKAAKAVSLRHILRLNLRHFFARMDEPEQRVRHFAPSQQAFIEARIPKVYHLNIIVRSRRGDAPSPPTRWRVVLDKRGIVRVERTRVA